MTWQENETGAPPPLTGNSGILTQPKQKGGEKERVGTHGKLPAATPASGDHILQEKE